MKLCEELAEGFYTVVEVVNLCGRSKSEICRAIRMRYYKECPRIDGMYFVPKSLLPRLAEDLGVEVEEVISRVRGGA
jgi:hypothetical protein